MEYPGTENGEGDIKKLPSVPDKSKINFSKPAKKKPLLIAAALHYPPFQVNQNSTHDITSNC
jgi:hypothetical protein